MDGIPARFVKDSASIIAGLLYYYHIINQINKVQYLMIFKIARVVPLLKKNDKTEVWNYRPVSILTTISKVFERVIDNQLEQYIVQHKLLQL